MFCTLSDRWVTIQDNEKKINFHCSYPLYIRLNPEAANCPIVRCKITD